jgi:putative sterol carrier protein
MAFAICFQVRSPQFLDSLISLAARSDSQTWIQIVNGEMQSATAMISGKLKIDWRTELLQQFSAVFLNIERHIHTASPC